MSWPNRADVAKPSWDNVKPTLGGAVGLGADRDCSFTIALYTVGWLMPESFCIV
jgi:hypothetical protein